MNPFEHLIKNICDVVEEKTEYKDSDLGRSLGVTKYAVHWITLKPGYKTSDPHAESLEEEFVYVVKGHPHVWINGHIHQLQPGMAVGFPAGTGIAHTFINNTSEEIDFVVLGERTKKDNKCSFPVNPELFNDRKDIWWADFPAQDFGMHDGQVGNLEHQKDLSGLDFIKNVYSLERKSFSYLGDTETFTRGTRLTNQLGMKVVGVWHEFLDPKHRTSWPHAHKLEEEFVLILKGFPTVWLNGYTYDLKPGDGVFFPPGTNIAHTVLNNSDGVVEYLGIGEANDGGPDEKILYPFHPKRNEECKEKGYLWEDPPSAETFGPHDGEPR